MHFTWLWEQNFDKFLYNYKKSWVLLNDYPGHDLKGYMGQYASSITLRNLRLHRHLPLLTYFLPFSFFFMAWVNFFLRPSKPHMSTNSLWKVQTNWKTLMRRFSLRYKSYISFHVVTFTFLEFRKMVTISLGTCRPVRLGDGGDLGAALDERV